MLCGTVPFKASNMKELHKMIIKGKYHLKEEVTDHAKHLLRALLETDPKKRLSVQKILEHPWMRQPENPPEIFNQEEKEIVGREFVYNNPNIPNRSEVINTEVEPWDCFTELNLDSINQTLRNESEKSIILAPFNSSLSDFNEDDYKDMKADLIIHRLFDDTTALCDKKDMVRFAARCRDQDRQYEINNNGDLDNGVYHKFVYSSRDGNPEPSSSFDGRGGSVNDLRP
jgi:serine/threonine protein kinase